MPEDTATFSTITRCTVRGFTKKRSRKAGMPPGSLVPIGDKRTETTELRLIHYDGERFDETLPTTLEGCDQTLARPGVTWLHICGAQQVEVLRHLDRFGLHPLVLEDIVNTAQRTKYEDYGEYVYIVLKMVSDSGNGSVDAEQISIVLGKNFVISVEEGPSGAFDSVREMIQKSRGQVRRMGADYLAYLLLDKVVDNYFLILETLGERIEVLQDELVERPSQDGLRRLHWMRRDTLLLRRSIWPLRGILGGLERERTSLFAETTRVYLRDVYDHTVAIVETIETFRETLSSVLEIYLSSVSNRMNEVMKVLTVITTIFMPLTFITGLYGMNFKYLPGLDRPWALAIVVGVMLAVVIFMLVQFRRKRWL